MLCLFFSGSSPSLYRHYIHQHRRCRCHRHHHHRMFLHNTRRHSAVRSVDVDVILHSVNSPRPQPVHPQGHPGLLCVVARLLCQACGPLTAGEPQAQVRHQGSCTPGTTQRVSRPRWQSTHDTLLDDTGSFNSRDRRTKTGTAPQLSLCLGVCLSPFPVRHRLSTFTSRQRHKVT